MPLPAALQARLKKRGIVVKAPEIVAAELEEQKNIEKRKNSLKHQPLPPGWFLVPDPGSGHEYFWNVHTNQVSWRHPTDPRAEITYPASWQQQSADGGGKEEKKELRDERTKQKIKTGKHPSLMKAQRQKEKSAPYRKGKGKDDDALDPMDPASYSDIGRGTWSSGLKEDSEVNTGVDTTATDHCFNKDRTQVQAIY